MTITPEFRKSTESGAQACTIPETERRLDESLELDTMSTIEALSLLNHHDAVAVDAVTAALPRIAELVEVAADRVRSGGSIHYFGAGTSGRLGALDAAELIPTFNADPSLVVAHMAGGQEAFFRAVENSEDSLQAGTEEASMLTSKDIAIGIAASGSTQYVRGALETARRQAAFTALISCNPDAPLTDVADVHILLRTGPEVLTGSTRLKAGSATKMALNGFSTALMIALGRTWSNLMVSMLATNAKLRARSLRILHDATGLPVDDCALTLDEADGDLRVAITASLANVPPFRAREALTNVDHSVRDALALIADAKR